MKTQNDLTWSALAEIATPTDDIVNLRLIPCRYKRLTPFVFTLGTTTVALTVRMEIPAELTIADHWPNEPGDAVRLLGDGELVEGLRILFATRHEPDPDRQMIRVWLGRTI